MSDGCSTRGAKQQNEPERIEFRCANQFSADIRMVSTIFHRGTMEKSVGFIFIEIQQ